MTDNIERFGEIQKDTNTVRSFFNCICVFIGDQKH